jgi:NADP-dependent 3-hydroxy acid dehydrogenase YdfG
MDDHDWYDVIDNNLNGTANTIRAFAPKMVPRQHGRIIVLSSMQGLHGTKTPPAIRHPNGAFSV